MTLFSRWNIYWVVTSLLSVMSAAADGREQSRLTDLSCRQSLLWREESEKWDVRRLAEPWLLWISVCFLSTFSEDAACFAFVCSTSLITASWSRRQMDRKCIDVFQSEVFVSIFTLCYFLKYERHVQWTCLNINILSHRCTWSLAQIPAPTNDVSAETAGRNV